jgi:hypothetical protein
LFANLDQSETRGDMFATILGNDIPYIDTQKTSCNLHVSFSGHD